MWNFSLSGPNPGRLRARIYVPEELAPGSALVVVLHGCLQSASEYDDGTGWSKLADRFGFALVFPQQRRRNNPLRGFNWFKSGDSHRDGGEPASVIQMVRQVAGQYRTDPRRVFVTGLSAGGAMASVLLATYPEVFAGGAIIAGLPYVHASTLGTALSRMEGEDGSPTARELATEVRDASGHAGAWPIVSVWHGGDDHTVDPSNAAQIVTQWRELHGLGAESTTTDAFDGYTRRSWHNAAGREVIEEYAISGMGHGTPIIAPSDVLRPLPSPYMLAGPVSSTDRIATFWGLAPAG
nr:PHB depolymerase family esterase [Acuticoccus kalidii]